MEAKLIIDFVKTTQSELFDEYEIFGIKKAIQYEKKEVINIPKDYFNDEFSKMSCLKLISKIRENEIILELNKDTNYCCIFCDDYGKTYHLLFNQENKNQKEDIDIYVYKNKYHLKKYDTNSTKYRKRVILANADFNLIKINDKDLLLSDFTKNIDAKSYQLSVYDLKKQLIVTKALEMPKKNISFEEIYKNNYQAFDNFIIDFNSATKDEKSFNKEFNELSKKHMNLVHQNYFLNITKNKIENELNKKEYIDFFYNMTIFKIYSEHMKGSMKSYDTVSKFMTYLNNKVDYIKKDLNLKLYQKILLIEQFGYILNKMTPDSFLKSDINYYIMKNKSPNSILDIVESFLNDYINNLTEDSDIFFKLLELDSGIGYLNGKKFHCFNMSNIDEIKAHLRDIFIETLITYKVNKNICAFVTTKTGSVAINVNEIPNFDKFFLEETLETYEMVEGKNVAAKIITFLLHEIYRHKKFLFDKEKFIISPFHFIRNGEIYILEYIYSISNEKNAIKILHDKNISDDGSYYELSYGKIGDYYTIEIIDCMNEYGDLLEDINLWTNDLESFKDYFKYKYILLRNNISLPFIKNINERIQNFKNLVISNGIDIESFYKKEKKKEIKMLGKKREIKKEDIFPGNTKDSLKKTSLKNIEDKYEDEDIDNELSKEDNNLFYLDFDKMSYDELIKLYYSGKLKGDSRDECHKRISAYEIQSKTK